MIFFCTELVLALVGAALDDCGGADVADAL